MDAPNPEAKIAILVGAIEPVFRRVVQRIGPGFIVRPIFMAKTVTGWCSRPLSS